MTCQEVEQSCSLYLYGELDFATEESFEAHCASCPSCCSVVEAERQWHAAIGNEPLPVPLELLSKCREDLHETIGVMRSESDPLWIRLFDSLGFRSNSWSMRLATASLLVCLGFGMSRLLEQHGFPALDSASNSSAQMSMFDPARAHIRAIQPSGDDGVRLIVDEVREHIITGSPEDDRIRHLLVAATKDPTDPAIRVDSLDVLKRSGGEDIRDVLLDSVQHDPNAGVRLKALEALSRFADDGTTRRTLTSVLSRDENADVRTQAIELLVAPQDTALPPQLTRVLENMMHSDPDEYIRMRCQQALHSPRGSVHVY
jgi:hypothetical protein